MSIVVKWRRAAIAALAASCALCADADDWREMMWDNPVALRDGVTIRAYALDKPRLMKAYVVRIDLTTQGIGFTATERAEGWGRRIPEVTNRVFRRETKRETTADFMARRRREGRNVEVTVNTTPWCPWPMPKGCEHCDPVGWCVADGVEVSRPKRREALFIVRKDGTAEITPDVPSGGTNDVAFAASAFDLLMTNGIDTISFNRPENAGLHPRTAFGLTPDRKTLVLLAIDGRQPGYSGGATLDDIRAILRREGVSDAVNMDGGGSTSLVVWDAKNGRPEMLNRHPGRTVRKNAVNFGITFSGNGSADIAGRAGGNFHSYEFNPVEDTPPPKGFKPFYIGHYARHGSRRITKSTAADTAAILAKADKNGLLTEEGVRLRDAVFGLEGPGDRVPIADAAEKCPAWEWSPMAANLQMVLYRNAKRETLVKFLYNEREMTIRGIEAVSAPYYRWKDLKASVLGERAATRSKK